MKTKVKAETDKRTQRQKFIDKARELETDERGQFFDRALRAVTNATPLLNKRKIQKS